MTTLSDLLAIAERKLEEFRTIGVTSPEQLHDPGDRDLWRLCEFVRGVLGQEPIAWEARAGDGHSLTDRHGDSVDSLVFYDAGEARDFATREQCDHDECPNGPDCEAGVCRALEVAPLYAVRAAEQAEKGGA